MKRIKTILFYFTLFISLVLLSKYQLKANNIQITNAQITEKNTLEHWANISFDMSIEHGWRINTGPANWSAAWVFVKYQVDNGPWHHATLSTQNADYTMPLNVLADPVSDGKGIFIYDSRLNPGTYTSYSTTGLVIRWNYGLDNILDNASNVNIQVFGIEMVYIPSSSYYLGSGGNETNHFFTSGGNNPYQVSSENPITVGTNAGNLYYQTDFLFQLGGDQNGPIPAAFPKGYQAFYVMRYEISQEQYTSFLNHLSRTQQISRVTSDISGDAVANTYVMSNTATMQGRNGIRCTANGNGTVNPITFYCDYNGNGIGGELNDGQNIACGYLGWSDLLAYYDWTGLRPMTELEYEKACRGDLSPVINEYAWGSTDILQSSTTLTNDGSISEITTNSGNGLCNYNHSGFPMRVGFAAGPASNRLQSGASYYGLSDLSGNIAENCVTIGTSQGRAYTGLHGNGELNGSGNFDVLNWPGTSGLSSRGGDFSTSSSDLRVSSRAMGSGDWVWFLSTSSTMGGRGARTAE